MFKKIYECQCHAEAIVLSEEDNDGMIYLTIFRNSMYEAYINTFKGKMRLIFDILFKDNIWSDCIILDKKTAKELGKDLCNFGLSKRRK